MLDSLEKPTSVAPSLMARIRIVSLSEADRGHLYRAALRAFGPGAIILDIDTVSYQGRVYSYSFQNGRFYYTPGYGRYHA